MDWYKDDTTISDEREQLDLDFICRQIVQILAG